MSTVPIMAKPMPSLLQPTIVNVDGVQAVLIPLPSEFTQENTQLFVSQPSSKELVICAKPKNPQWAKLLQLCKEYSEQCPNDDFIPDRNKDPLQFEPLEDVFS